MNKRQQVTELWHRNFQDSEEYVRFYFDRKYSDENSLVYEENGKALSALLMLPYPMNWKGVTIATSYISGACTLEEARNRGLMTQLLKTAFQEMNKRGILLSTLIPAEDWLFNYYENPGYAVVFDYSSESVRVGAKSSSSEIKVMIPEKYDADFADRLFPYFDQQMQKRPCCIGHPIEDYRSIVEDTYLSAGYLAATRPASSDTITGWALALPEDGVIRVKEMFCDSPAEREALLQAFSGILNITELECRTPARDSGSKRYGMARIINVLPLLEHWAALHTDLSVSLKVNDPFLATNQGIYILDQGVCRKNDSPDIQTDIETDIPTLTRALLGYRPDQLPRALAGLTEQEHPYMNLMLD